MNTGIIMYVQIQSLTPREMLYLHALFAQFNVVFGEPSAGTETTNLLLKTMIIQAKDLGDYAEERTRVLKMLAENEDKGAEYPITFTRNHPSLWIQKT